MSNAPDFAAIEDGEYVATYEAIPYVAQLFASRVERRWQWVIRRGEAFIATATHHSEVRALIAFAKDHAQRAA